MNFFTKTGAIVAIVALSISLASCSSTPEPKTAPKPEKVSILEGEDADAVFQEVDVIHLNTLEDGEVVKVSLDKGALVSLQGSKNNPQYNKTWSGKVKNNEIASFIEPVLSPEGAVVSYASITGISEGKTSVILKADDKTTVTIKVVIN